MEQRLKSEAVSKAFFVGLIAMTLQLFLEGLSECFIWPLCKTWCFHADQSTLAYDLEETGKVSAADALSSSDVSALRPLHINCGSSIFTPSSKIINNILRNPCHILDEVWEGCCSRAILRLFSRGLIMRGSLEAMPSITYLVLWSETGIMGWLVYVNHWGPVLDWHCFTWQLVETKDSLFSTILKRI